MKLRNRNYGAFGGPVPLFEQFLQESEELHEAIARSGINPYTGQQITDPGLIEAFSQEFEPGIYGGQAHLAEAAGQADFKSYLWEPQKAGVYQGYRARSGKFEAYTSKTNLESFDVKRIKGHNGLTRIAYVGEFGQYIEAVRTFRPETGISVDTYGAQIEYTRKLLRTAGAKEITDDTPLQFGKSMADFVTASIISFIVANPNAPDGSPMYHSSRGNLRTAALDEQQLLDMADWLATRRDPDNRPIEAEVKYAIVKLPSQKARLVQILKSITLELKTQGTSVPATTDWGRATYNPIPNLGLLQPENIIEDPYMPDAEDIYFFADPDQLAAFTVGYLDGKTVPDILMTAETAMHVAASGGSGADPYSYQGDSIGYKVRHDYGSQAIDPIGTYKLSPA